MQTSSPGMLSPSGDQTEQDDMSKIMGMSEEELEEQVREFEQSLSKVLQLACAEAHLYCAAAVAGMMFSMLMGRVREGLWIKTLQSVDLVALGRGVDARRRVGGSRRTRIIWRRCKPLRASIWPSSCA